MNANQPEKTETWHAVFSCAWKIDIGNDTRETEKPIALFKYKEHAKEYAKGWPTTAEVREVKL